VSFHVYCVSDIDIASASHDSGTETEKIITKHTYPQTAK